VVAALLHSFYLFGQFRDPRPGITDYKRKYIIHFVGDEVESLVKAYTEFLWKRASIDEYAKKLDQMSIGNQETLILCVVNELEENLDFGLAYSRKDHAKLNEESRGPLHLLAKELISDEFSREWDAAIYQENSSNVSERLKRSDRHFFSSHPAPRKHRFIGYIYKNNESSKRGWFGTSYCAAFY